MYTDIGRTMAILEKSGAIIRNDHFVYASGRHGSDYIDKRRACRNPKDVEEMARQFSLRFRHQVEAVVAPAYGAIVLGAFTARALTFENFLHEPVAFVIAEKAVDGGFDIPDHSRDLIEGKRVLVMEDILTTGGSAWRTVQEVERLGGKVQAVAAIVNRGGVKPADVGLQVGEIYALLDFDLATYAEEECPLCEANVPVNTVLGHGKSFRLTPKF